MSTTASVIWVLALPYTWPHTPAVASITQLAEILNIQDNTQMSTMVTANALTAQIGRIDSNMGHKFTAEDAAQYWAMGVDRSDPPHNPWVGWWITTNQAGGLPPPELPLPRRGGGISGGGRGNPHPPQGGQQPGNTPHLSNNLVGNPPFKFNGNKSKSEEFMNAQKTSQRANKGNVSDGQFL